MNQLEILIEDATDAVNRHDDHLSWRLLAASIAYLRELQELTQNEERA